MLRRNVTGPGIIPGTTIVKEDQVSLKQFLKIQIAVCEGEIFLCQERLKKTKSQRIIGIIHDVMKEDRREIRRLKRDLRSIKLK